LIFLRAATACFNLDFNISSQSMLQLESSQPFLDNRETSEEFTFDIGHDSNRFCNQSATPARWAYRDSRIGKYNVNTTSTNSAQRTSLPDMGTCLL
jgi:hypothetical protein